METPNVSVVSNIACEYLPVKSQRENLRKKSMGRSETKAPAQGQNTRAPASSRLRGSSGTLKAA